MSLRRESRNDIQSIDSISGYDDEEKMITKEKREEIAQNETRAVFCLRMLVFTVLATSTVAVVYSVYEYMTNAEQREFQNKFDSDTRKVFESIGKVLDQTLGGMDAFVLQLIAYARYSNSTWPYVAMPGFSVQAAKFQKISKSFFTGELLFVEPEERDQWQQYAAENLWWLEEGVGVQKTDEDWKGPTNFEYHVSYKIYRLFEGPTDVSNAGLPKPYRNNYMPAWQQHPIVPGGGTSGGQQMPVNNDFWGLPHVAVAVDDATKYQRVTIQPPGNIIIDQSDELKMKVVYGARNWAKQYINPEDDETEPFVAVNYPMYDSMDSLRANLTGDEKPLGIFFSAFFYREFIRDILPIGSDVIVVLSAPCGVPFTYRLEGPKAIYLGPGDLHDPKYDDIAVSHTLIDTMAMTKESNEGSSYTGLPLSETFCPRLVTLYPSQQMEDVYKTNRPVIFTVVVAIIFLFTSLVFICYDCIVDHRQKVVMQRALASGAIVSSLFPEKVRQQLYDEIKQEGKKETFTEMLNDPQPGDAQPKGKPIAELFENTTVYFADLSGFTSWSSKRTPVQVFELLEALYGAFDKIAAKLGVFKVETIGDCYVAVTGIPEPQKHHAVIMCRFANECMDEMRNVLHQVAESLGEDTKDLAMRAGLHSGSTTAGVLRGEKGRFQLFGDTVNTASRMESNGVKGKIHVSETTANALIEAGKRKWLVTREDKIVAKGKGEMQTYFVEIGGAENCNDVTRDVTM